MASALSQLEQQSKKNLALLNKQRSLLEEEPMEPPAAEGGESDNLAAFEGPKGNAEESLQRQRNEEVKKQNKHDLNIASLNQAVALATDELNDAKKDHMRISEKKPRLRLSCPTQTSMAADEKALQFVTLECNDASAAWETRQKEAKAEMAAIGKAKEILTSGVTVFLQVAQAQPTLGSDSLKEQTKITKLRQKLVNHFRTVGNIFTALQC